MLTPALGVGVTAAFTARLTAAALEELALGDGLGDGVLLPDAGALGVGSAVGPGEDDAADDGGSPSVGVVPTSTTRGVGAPCAPTSPGDCDDEGDGLGVTVVDEVGVAAPGTGTWPLLSANALYANRAAPIPATV